MGVVIGETASIGDDVTMYQGVTLGGTGKQRGKRHPTVEDDAVIGVGASVLGAVTIGEGARVGAGSVVLKDVPPHTTAVGTPARAVSWRDPASGETRRLEHLPDPDRDTMISLMQRIEELEARVREIEHDHADRGAALSAAIDSRPRLASDHRGDRSMTATAAAGRNRAGDGGNSRLQHPDPAQGAAANDRAGEGADVRLRRHALRQRAHRSRDVADVVRRHSPLPGASGLRGAAHPELHRHRRQDHRPGQRGGNRPGRVDRDASSPSGSRRCGALNVLPATHYPRATEEVGPIIEMVQGLIDRGHAYPVDGDVYFRVRSFAGYGKLSHRDLDDLLAGARIEVDERKEDPLDFALWKAAKPGEPSWESPWGPGRPGWHIECSAMSSTYLDGQVDIHGGGADLIFPHHENEIAQSEAFLGVEPFARYWVHNGLVRVGAEKMSKSLGNFVRLKEIVDRGLGPAFRLMVLQSHYRAPLTYTEEGLLAAERGLSRLRAAADPMPPWR